MPFLWLVFHVTKWLLHLQPLCLYSRQEKGERPKGGTRACAFFLSFFFFFNKSGENFFSWKPLLQTSTLGSHSQPKFGLHGHSKLQGKLAKYLAFQHL